MYVQTEDIIVFYLNFENIRFALLCGPAFTHSPPLFWMRWWAVNTVREPISLTATGLRTPYKSLIPLRARLLRLRYVYADRLTVMSRSESLRLLQY